VSQTGGDEKEVGKRQIQKGAKGETKNWDGKNLSDRE